jgi:hypothetical protein
MSPEEVAQLHAERPGHSLVSYGEVGLPIYRIEVHALVLDPKEIGPFDEFILRAVSQDLTSIESLRSLIGLPAVLLEAKVVDLLSSNDLAVRPEPGETQSSLHITSKGRQTLETARSVVPEEVLIEFDYDGLSRCPIPFVENWVAARTLRERGVREIPPSPSKPPQLEDIDVAAVRQIVRSLADRRQSKRELLALRAINRRSLRFQPAVALVYKAEDSEEVQVAFSVGGGRLSAEHEAAFARARFRKRLVPDAGSPSTPEGVAAELLGEDLVRRADRKRTLILHRILASTAVAEEAPDAPAESRQPGPIVVEAREELAAMPVRPLETFEHPRYLQHALSTTARRLVIISPWLRRAVVDDAFLTQLDLLLARQVEVFIGWGISGPNGEEEDGDYRVRQLLGQLAGRYPNLHFKYLGDTHAKVLLKDQEYVVVTSFNWLSYRGDPRRTFRDERGILVAMPSVIDQQFETLKARFIELSAAP